MSYTIKFHPEDYEPKRSIKYKNYSVNMKNRNGDRLIEYFFCVIERTSIIVAKYQQVIPHPSIYNQKPLIEYFLLDEEGKLEILPEDEFNTRLHINHIDSIDVLLSVTKELASEKIRNAYNFHIYEAACNVEIILNDITEQ